eukprot:COSAG01_NODE_5498_length_4224_cov_2.723152_3_plen_88_part_00
MAGLIALANAHRAPKPALGPLNALLYKLASTHPGVVFNDIVEGHNRCVVPGRCEGGGFSCAPGWDAVTGLGSLNLAALLAALAELGL